MNRSRILKSAGVLVLAAALLAWGRQPAETDGAAQHGETARSLAADEIPGIDELDTLEAADPATYQEGEPVDENSATRGAGLFNATGVIRYLRVNDINGNFGPCPNCITTEIVFNFTNNNNWYGMRLTSDTNLVPHQAALDLLRDAFNNGWTVSVDYTDDGLAGRTIFPVAFGRVTISRP